MPLLSSRLYDSSLFKDPFSLVRLIPSSLYERSNQDDNIYVLHLHTLNTIIIISTVFNHKMAAPNQSPTAEPNQGFPTDSNQTPNRGSIFNQTPDQGSIFNQTPDKGSNQTLTPSSNQGATSRPHSGTNTSSDPATTVNSDPGTKVDRVIRTLPIDLNSAIFTSDGKAQQQTQYGYLVIYREALTYHFKERPHYAETLGQYFNSILVTLRCSQY